jgi:hypothetical protein
MTLTGKTYDTLKWCAQIFFPALGTLYFGLAQIWDLPSAEEVVGTIVIIDAFLGVILGISQSNYQGEGTIDVIKKAGGGLTYSLELDGDPAELQHQKMVTFKVNKARESHV